MRDEAERALTPLIGLQLRAGHRAADMQMFQLGDLLHMKSLRGEAREVGEYALHLQCTWRIRGPEGIVVGSADLYRPKGDSDDTPEDFDWQKGNRRDERLAALFTKSAEMPLRVEKVSADDIGGFILDMNRGFRLEAFPAYSSPNEFRRLFRPRDLGTHFVVTGRGIETEH
jgi:hypothetical protein